MQDIHCKNRSRFAFYLQLVTDGINLKLLLTLNVYLSDFN